MQNSADKLLREAGCAALAPVISASAELMAGMKGKRVLVTGATGMIGSIVVAALKTLGEIRVYEADSKWSLGDALKCNAEYVIHGAGYAQPKRFMAAPLETIELNTSWTSALAKALPKNGRMVFLSSSEVYSGSPHQKHTEDDIGNTSPAHERAAYIESKRCGEAIVHAARGAGIAIAAARVSLAYGPGVKRRDTRVVNEFITQAIETGEIRLKDGGQARRTYCYVTDAVEMILQILLRGRQPVYNVSGIGETTVLSLARKIRDITKCELAIPRGFGSAMGGAPAHVTADNGRYRSEFGKRSFVGLDEGLERTIAWHHALQGVTMPA